MLPLDRVIPESFEEVKTDLEDMYKDISQAVNGFEDTYSPKIYSGDTDTEMDGSYGSRLGYYYRKGIFVDAWFNVTWSGNTKFDDLIIDLPYKIKLSDDIWTGVAVCNNVSYAAGTQTFLNGFDDSYQAKVGISGSGIPFAYVKLSAAGTLRGHIRYIGQEQS